MPDYFTDKYIHSKTSNSSLKPRRWSMGLETHSLACYDRPIKRLQGDEKEGRSSGNSNWLTPAH